MSAPGTDPLPGPPVQVARARSVGPALFTGIAAGLVVAVAGAWRPGLVVSGVVLAVAGALRLALPAVRLGSFAVRSRIVDAVTSFLVAALLVGLAITFPSGHS